MIPLALADLPPGRLETAPGAEQITGVKIDSRLVEPGDLFVAVGRGAEFLTPPKDHELEIRCYLRDPDGYLIEVGQGTGILEQMGRAPQ